MKKIRMVLIVLAVLLVNIVPVNATERTVKVAYPIQIGLSEIDEDGLYSGYTYEYLKEISRFTNWKLEFVQLEGSINEQLLSAMDKVKTGELDLVGGVVYSDTLINDYDYSAINYGMGNMAIYVNANNAEINDTSIYSMKDLTVGIVSNKKEENSSLKDFGDINGINIKQVLYETTAQLFEAVNNDEVDAIVLSDLSIVEGDYRVVARFSPRPFYFLTTKGNRELMAELNEAMTQLNKEQPNYMSNLHEKYFSLANNEFILTEAEKKYIENNSKIDVLILGGKAPLQYYDEKKGKVVGITIDVLNYIGKLSGITFNYLYAKNNTEYDKLLKEKNPPIIGGVYKSNPDKYDTTKSYLESGMSLVTNKSIDYDNLSNKKFATLSGSQFNNIELVKDVDNIIFYDTQLDCIKAINEGKADYTYMINHIAVFYNTNYDYNNINIIPQGNQISQGTYFAINNNENILNIINKGIDSLSNSKIEDIVFKNASITKNQVTFFDYVENNPLQVIAFSVMLIAIVALFFLIWRNYTNKRNNERILNEYYRYQQISEFSHDCFIEYNIQMDTLVLMGGGAKLLSDKSIIKDYIKKKRPEYEILEEVTQELKPREAERLVKFFDGNKRWVKITLRPIFDETNKSTHVIGKVIDIQSEKEVQLLWQDLAQKDSLTKIYNSAACREITEAFLKEKVTDKIALMIIDIDNFKQINDTYGHLCGDIVLQKIAEALKSISQSQDIFGRVGGDEFLIVLKYPQEYKEIEEYCLKMLKVTSCVAYQDNFIATTISIGVVISGNNTTYDELYKLADEALYKVKNSGRNNYCIVENKDMDS